MSKKLYQSIMVSRYRMKEKLKKSIFLLALCTILLIVRFTNTLHSNREEEKIEKYRLYLEQVTEQDFMAIEGMKSASAVITQNEKEGDFSIELSLECEREVSSREIEHYKKILAKQYEDFVLIINGINK